MPGLNSVSNLSKRVPAAALLGMLLVVLARPEGASGAERWTIRPGARGAERTITAERVRSGVREAFTIAGARGAVLSVPAIALDGSGRAAAAWISESAAAGFAVEAALFDGREWGRPARLASSPRYLGQPCLASDGRGGYWVAMTRDERDGDDIALLRWRGSVVEEAGRFGEPGRPDVDPWLERSPEGEVLLSWLGYDGGAYRPRAHLVAPGRSAVGSRPGLPAPEALGAEDQAVRASSRAAVAWSDGARVGSAPLAPEAGEASALAPVEEAGPEAAATAVGGADLSRVLGLGDSTTWGRGSTYMGPPTDYLTRLENQLRGPWAVRNAGRPGITSAGLLRYVDADLAWKPGLTLLSIGINDALLRYSASTITFNITEIVGKIRASGGAAIIATTTPVIDDETRADQHAYLASVVNPAIRSVAAGLRVPLVDLWGYFLARSDWRSFIYAPHGNHLTDAGYELVASRFRLLLQRNDLKLPARGTARGPLVADVSLAAWDLPAPGALTPGGNAGATQLLRDAVSPLADDGIVAAAALDLDGDGIDSIAVVRERLGETSLTTYTAPLAGTLADPDILAAVTVESVAGWLPAACGCPAGQIRSRRALTHLFAIDQDGDGKDEFGLVCTRTCAVPGAAPLERQVVEIWRASQPGGAPPVRLVKDEWRLPGTGWIHDIAAAQLDADPAQEVVLLSQSPRVSTLHTLNRANPDAIRLLGSGRYGRLLACATATMPEGWNLCDRWERRGRSECGLLEIRTLTPRVMVFETPPAGAVTRAGNSEALLYSWSLTESPLVAARCTDTGEEWSERGSDVLGLAAADLSRPADGRDELLVLRLRAADALEAWSLPRLPASSRTRPSLVALDKWVRTGTLHQYLVRTAAIPDGFGGAKSAVLLWLTSRP